MLLIASIGVMLVISDGPLAVWMAVCLLLYVLFSVLNWGSHTIMLETRSGKGTVAQTESEDRPLLPPEEEHHPHTAGEVGDPLGVFISRFTPSGIEDSVWLEQQVWVGQWFLPLVSYAMGGCFLVGLFAVWVGGAKFWPDGWDWQLPYTKF
ncbi:hypothetical protein [Rhizobium terrae]|uniref:hypothetical protein n=1 Tax=Rhizobium terrae TaxID=2171756 RepID=UPI0013C30555|nr:hypothetical protein [Rhizobium terrae]